LVPNNAEACSETQERRFHFSPLNASAVEIKKLVADWHSGHVQTLMHEPESMSGLQAA
jgi:hypothetical protein